MLARLGVSRLSSLIITRTPSAAFSVARQSVPPSAVASRVSIAQIVLSRGLSSTAVRLFDGEREAEPSDTLFVGNLPWEAPEADIAKLFENLDGFVEMNSGMWCKHFSYV